MKRYKKRLVDLINIILIITLVFSVFPVCASASEKKGDVNHNGMLDSRDALLIQRYCIGLTKLTDEEIKLADYNGDSKISSKDVLCVLRCVIGLDKEEDTDEVYISDIQVVNQVMDLVNNERKSAGLSPLSLDAKLCKVAQLRSSELAQKFSHERPNGTQWYTAIDEADIYYHFAGENIAGGYSTAEKVFNGWMNSEAHRKNIMSADFDKIGIGYTYDANTDFKHYWDQLFIDGEADIHYEYDLYSDNDDKTVDLNDGETEKNFANDVVRYVNIEREREGLEPVELDSELCRLSHIRANETIEYFSHDRPNGDPWYMLLREENIKYHIAGENIAAGYPAADRVVTAWMNSDGHRANIMTPGFRKMGLGYVYAPGTVYEHYWDQIFTDQVDDSDTHEDISDDSDLTFKNELLRLVNEERQKQGVAPLELDDALCRAAQIRSGELVQKVSHERPNGDSWNTCLSDENISYRVAAENIAAGFAAPEKVFSAWLNSDGHRKTMLSPEFNKIGIGYTFSNDSEYKNYWDQLFTD